MLRSFKREKEMYRFCEKCGTAATSHMATICTCGGAIKCARSSAMLVVDTPNSTYLALLRAQQHALNVDDSGDPDAFVDASKAIAASQLKRPSSR